MESNTRRGPQFRTWLRTKFRHVPLEEFAISKKKIIFLEDNEKRIRDFCNSDLDIGVSKRPDFVARFHGKYVVGEAKFLSASGGNQDRGFDDALKLATKTEGVALKVAILDGPLWISPNSKAFKRIALSNVYAFSALLLEKFLKSI